MPRYEYRVVPAPTRATRIKGVKGTDQRFAVALSAIMNEMGAEGWDYLRTDTLPCEERQGLTRKVTTFQNMLVFRRTLDRADPATAPAAPQPVAAERSEQVLAIPSFRATARLADIASPPHVPPLRAVSEDPVSVPRLGAATRDEAARG